MRVLLVDDNRLMLEGLKSLLEVYEVEVAGTASDGTEGLRLARELRPDVILMDIRMPKCDGLTATRLIKAAMPQARIVILTTSTEDRDLFDAIRSGACGYLVKSMDAEGLVEALKEAVDGTPPFSPGLAAKLVEEFARSSRAPDNPETGRQGVVEERGPLSERQIEVLRLVSQGLTYKEVGDRLKVTPRTVKYHMAEIMDRLHMENRSQVLAFAGKMVFEGIQPPAT